MNIRNELTVTLSFENVILMAEIILKISESAFASFPIRDLNNINCWLATIFSQTSDDAPRLRGIGLIKHSFSIGNFSMGINCTSCTSPDFDELLLSLYEPDNVTALETTLQENSESLLGVDFLPALLDQIVVGSAKQCPHHPNYDPDATPASFLRSQANSFWTMGMIAPVEKTSYFNVANAIFAGLLLMFGVLCRWLVKRRNQKWVQSLSREGTFFYRRQEEKEHQMESMLDQSTTALFRSPRIPWKIRWGVPFAILVNTALYMGGHLGVLSTVNVDASLAGEEFTIYSFLEFTFIESTKRTYDNGGAEMAILIWIFTGIWPYIKLFLSLLLWMLPPNRISVAQRGRILLWLDALAKLSVIDIFTMLLGVAVLLIFVGGPDESLQTDGVLYTMKAIVIPRAGFYCLIIAQRMSRVSSKFFLEYHEKVIQLATREHERKTLLESHTDDSSAISTGSGRESQQYGGSPQSESDLEEMRSLVETNNDDDGLVPEVFKDEEVSSSATHSYHFDDVLPTNEPDIDQDSDIQEHENDSSTPREFRWGTMGVVFGGITILAVFIIGCIFAPAISLDASSVAGLAVESGKTFDEAVREYGVFFVISGVLVKARFVLDTKVDYLGFTLLAVAGIVSIGMVFFIQAYQFIKRKLKERQLGPKLPSFGHRGCGLPSYFRLYKWNHMEIYLISVAIGVWQLGSVCSYAIHMYCYILRRIYTVMTFVGLVEETSAQCYRIQATLPGNLIIIGSSFFILLFAFVFQASSQYRKNITESLRWIDADDVPRLSLAWSRDKGKNSRYSHLTASLSMEQFSDDDLGPPPPPGTPCTQASTPPGTPRSGDDDSATLTPPTRSLSSPDLETTPPPRGHDRLPSSFRSFPPRTSSALLRFETLSTGTDDEVESPPAPPRMSPQEMPSTPEGMPHFIRYRPSSDESSIR
jgi:hypothetical protein